MNTTLGWINLALITAMGLIYPLRMTYLKTKDKKLLSLYKTMRVIHPLTGGVIILIGLIHGYMSLGTIRLHTGLLIVIVLLFMAGIALLGPRTKLLKKNWRVVHRFMGLLLWSSILLHLFYRSLI